MIFRQVFDNKSSTYTYLIASAKGREAVIIDPVIENVESYIKLLNDLDLKLVKVIDTHIHADHVTGASKLKQATNCSTLMGEHTPADTVDIKLKDDDIIKIDQLDSVGINYVLHCVPGKLENKVDKLISNLITSNQTKYFGATVVNNNYLQTPLSKFELYFLNQKKIFSNFEDDYRNLIKYFEYNNINYQYKICGNVLIFSFKKN